MPALALVFRLLRAYVRIIFGTIYKRGWRPRHADLPPAQSHMLVTVEAKRLALFTRLVPYPAASPPAGPTDSPLPDPQTTSSFLAAPQPMALPALFVLTSAFPAVLECLSQLPFPVLGGVVNQRATHTLREAAEEVCAGDKLLHSVHVLPATRQTPGGHTEFDIAVTSKHVPSSRTVYEATLTMARLSGQQATRTPSTTTATTAGEGGTTPDTAVSGQAGAAEPSAPGPKDVGTAGMTLLDTLKLDESLGRRWALLDGDFSPMHLSRATARMLGFKGTVANVNCMLAYVEAALIRKGVIPIKTGVTRVPYEISASYKRPCLLPAQLQLWLAPAPAAAGGAGGAGHASRSIRVVTVSSSGQPVLLMEGSVKV